QLVASRSQAQQAIADGRIELEGIVAQKSSTMVTGEASIRVIGEPDKYVSRGGLKLEAALTSFPIEVAGAKTLDVGASTGGFTDCLLQHGALSVTAVDVGYGQLDWKLRNDERVEVYERLNFRHADPAQLGAPFGVVVADLSFISLRTVAAALRNMGDDNTHYVLLVKPQFEVGKEQVGKGGIVRDPALHGSALSAVAAGLDEHGIGAAGAVPSPITGAKGNREFLLWAKVGPRSVSSKELETVTSR
ncbi:MAG: TlyA family RNA methyltransferase, partial [Acidimicrobiia bacterium]